jgi:hypothetical protein
MTGRQRSTVFALNSLGLATGPVGAALRGGTAPTPTTPFVSLNSTLYTLEQP